MVTQVRTGTTSSPGAAREPVQHDGGVRRPVNGLTSPLVNLLGEVVKDDIVFFFLLVESVANGHISPCMAGSLQHPRPALVDERQTGPPAMSRFFQYGI